jgi:beta-glucosidase-like glycosyl hydrolase/CubicO group peptidase (beta-lactamase class C family)
MLSLIYFSVNRKSSFVIHQLLFPNGFFLKKNIVTFLLFISFNLAGQENFSTSKQYDTLNVNESMWADSVFQTLDPDERIAQLFMAAAWSNKDSGHIKEISDLICNYKIGGLMFMQGGPGRQARLTNYYRSLSKVPLMIAMDAEWGLGMRLDSTISFPRQMMLGSITGDSLIYEMGKEIARQCKRMGININFAPVADINNNPENPVINSRSFGENKLNVTAKSLAYMHGLQDNGVLACCKHFPGHGDTDIDSHLSLPVIKFPRCRLDTLELFPFKKLIDNGIGSIMVAHLSVSALDSSVNSISTLSAKVINTLLKNELGFKGLVFTDALNMKAVSNLFGPGELEAKALIAGNDILLFSENIPAAIKEIKNTVLSGLITQEEIDSRCKKILNVKYRMGLSRTSPVNTKNLLSDLNTIHSDVLKREMVEASLTMVKNENGLIPLNRLDTLRIAAVCTGESDSTIFQKYCGLYSDITNFGFDPAGLRRQVSFAGIISDTLNKYRNETDSCTIERIILQIPCVAPAVHRNFISGIISGLLILPENPDSCLLSDILLKLDQYPQQYINTYITEFIDKLKGFNLVLAAITSTDRRPSKNFGIMPETLNLISRLAENNNLVLVVFANPYSLSLFGDLSKVRSVIVSYEDQELTQEFSAQLIFGGIPAQGKLPVTATAGLPAGKGIISPQTRLKYTIPEEAGIDSKKLVKIDSLAQNAIVEKATPGCQVLVAYKGSIIFQKSYGCQTYQNPIPVKNTDIYDLASLTKISATAVSLMKLYEEKRINLDARMSDYLPLLKKSNKKKIKLKDVLTHQARLQPWIPFYLSTISNSKLKESIYSNCFSGNYPVKVADGIFIRSDYPDSMFRDIIKSKLLDKHEYRYSDLGFILSGKMIEIITDKKLDNYTEDHFYKRLGAATLGFRPLERFPVNRIVPTENDTVFRHQLLRGYVHDQAAAMLGGIAGHAGLFSDANDLAKLMQMLLQDGTYGGEQYLNASTVKLFTSCQYCNKGNRRGLGFDKPETDINKESPVCRSASPSSFGHSGFTGTMAWVDPETELVYIFLSNRIHPDQGNNKLVNMNVRTNIQQAIYDALK